MNSTPPNIRILLLEDVPTDAELIEVELRDAGLSFTSKVVQTKREFTDALEAFQPDIVLSDFTLPAFDGLSALNIVQERLPELPVIMVTGAVADELAVGMLKAGAKDYVLKDRLARLKPAIERVMRERQTELGRTLAEEALRDSENRFRTMANSAPVLIWVAGTDQGCNWFNTVWLDFTGRTLEEEQGNGWARGIHPDDLDRCLEIYTTHFDQRTEFQMEYRLRRHDGKYSWLVDKGVPLTDGQGRFSGYIGSCIDVTPAKELAIDLGVQTLRLQTILKMASDGIHILDTVGNIVQFSDSFALMLGYTCAEMSQLNVADWDTQIPEAELLDELYRLIRHPAKFTTQHRRKDGSVIDVEINARGVELEGERYLYASARDITERKALDAVIAESRNLLSTIIDTAPVRVFWKDRNLRYLGCNRAFAQDVGLECPDDVNGKDDHQMPWADLAELYRTDDREIIESGIAKLCYEEPKANTSGQEMWLQTSKVPLRNQGNEIFGVLGIYEDITERKKTQDRIERLTREQHAMLDNELVGIMKLRNQHILWKNKAMERIFGLRPGELEGQSSRVLFPDDAAWQALVEPAYPILNTHGGHRTQLEMVRKDGEKLWMDVSAANLSETEGESLWVLVDITRAKEYQDKIEHIAYHDALTGLPNRLLMADRLNQALALAKRSGKMLAVCYLDLDGFKPVNDAFGHAAGDKLLIEIARRLQASIRTNDTVARLGGDEFVLLLTGLGDAGEYQVALQRVTEAVNQPVALDDDQEAAVTTSIGIALFPQDATAPDTLLRYADQALYTAKQSGRNRCHFFDRHLEQRTATHHEALERIRQGLAAGEFSLHYQPKVDFGSNAVVGMEALIRWQHPVDGLLEPAAFLPAVENDDLALTMGAWVIREALRQMHIWRGEGIDLRVSVNVFARQLHQPDFVANLRQILGEYPDASPGQLQLEINESARLPELPVVQQIITDCRQFGVGFSIDDFGTGCSSLAYLRHLSVAELKIDRSFVCDMLTNPEDQAIIEGIIGLGLAFHRSVIAEGVETAGQIHRLLELGCKLMQGNGIARPMPAGQIAAWVRDFQPGRFLGR
ncbi:MAG: EAL domain-containing protein [Candidatus Methylumidiphilus sp.]